MARIGVFGAGAIGSYLGATLAHAGSEVVLVGRKRLLDAVSEHGLQIEALGGQRTRVDAARLHLHEDVEALRKCECVFVTVKSGQTQEAGETLASVLDKACVVVSFQNGISNPIVLRRALPDHTVLAGIVPFNVVWDQPAIFRQTTSGPLVLQEGHEWARRLKAIFEDAGLELELVADAVPRQWGKLLLNLNNAINALSGLPLQQELADRDYRRCLAGSQAEALRLLRRKNLRVDSPLRAPLAWIPHVLRMPTPIFSRVAKAMLQVAPDARSSMYDDLERARKTEIDYLNGEVVALAESLGTQAPINAAIVALIRQAEERGQGSPMLTGPALRRALSL
jgi:2-dehydropantoate 2-reductase